MAYAWEYTAARQPDGSLVLTITETDADDGDEWGPVPVPAAFTISQDKVTASGGTATSVTPERGRAAAWTSDDANHLGTHAWGAATPGLQARCDDPLPCLVPGRQLYGRSGLDAAADTVVTELWLRRGAP